MHLPLATSADDASPHRRPVRVVGTIDWQATGPRGGTSATFDGRTAALEVSGMHAPRVAAGDFVEADTALVLLGSES